MAIAEPTQEQPTEDQNDVQVPEGQILHTLSDDDDDSDEQDINVLDKRGKRSWAREAKQKLADYETKFAEMNEKLAKLEGRASAPQQPVYVQPQQQERPDPIKQRLAEIQRQKVAINRTIADPNQKVDFDKLSAEYEELDNERVTLLARRQAPQQQPQISYEETVMRAEFPDMFPDQGGRVDLYHEANAEYSRLRSAGKAHGLATMREAASRVFQRLGVGQRAPAPNEADKKKLAGISGRAGASGQGGNQIALSKRDVSDALAYFNGATGKYASWTDKQKVDHWVKNVKLKA